MRFLTKQEALEKLNNMGLNINMRQLTRAASPNERDRRALPFFKDPITGKLVIEEDVLIKTYKKAQEAAMHA